MKYFGTDGIRQNADKFTSEFSAAIVIGLDNYAETLKLVHTPRVLIAGDTRESTQWILQDLADALEACGMEYANAEVLPTPAINYCFYQMGFDFAIDVTASHNPYTDNGIKIFERGDRFGLNYGVKLCEQGRNLIERALSEDSSPLPDAGVMDRESVHDEAVEIYCDHIKEYLDAVDDGVPLTGLTLGVDCANGAMSAVYQQLFEPLGAKIHDINYSADYDLRINDHCGSTHLEALRKLVLDRRLDFGVAFDGDGDRCLLIDSNGETVNGDQIIVILANYLGLKSVAATVMANQGLLNWAAENHIQMEITDVGDTNVAIAMREHGLAIGGEESGHVILPGEPTGDGMLTALMVAKAVAETGTPLHDLAAAMTKTPQVNITMPADAHKKTALASNDAIKSSVAHFDEKVKSLHGRILVRPSGTEPLIRISVWGDDLAAITTLAEEIKHYLEENL